MPTVTKKRGFKTVKPLRTTVQMPASTRKRVAARLFLETVMKAFKEGKSCEDVADALGMQKNSVYQKLNTYKNMGVKNLPHLPLNRSTTENVNDPEMLQALADELRESCGVELDVEESEEAEAEEKPKTRKRTRK